MRSRQTEHFSCFLSLSAVSAFSRLMSPLVVAMAAEIRTLDLLVFCFFGTLSTIITVSSSSLVVALAVADDGKRRLRFRLLERSGEDAEVVRSITLSSLLFLLLAPGNMVIPGLEHKSTMLLFPEA